MMFPSQFQPLNRALPVRFAKASLPRTNDGANCLASPSLSRDCRSLKHRRTIHLHVFILLTCWFLFDCTTAESDQEEGSLFTDSTLLSNERKYESADSVEDSLYDPMQGDMDCSKKSQENSTCNVLHSPPDSTIETETIRIEKADTTCSSFGGLDPDAGVCKVEEEEIEVDIHWGLDPNIQRMRDKLLNMGSGTGNATEDMSRPPVFLMPGLASTRLVAWRFKKCSHPLLSDIKVQDYVWLNLNLMMQMSTIDCTCMNECLRLGRNQSDADGLESGCKLRPDEGLDAISSLSPGSIGPSLLVGGTNTVYAWLIQWLADNLGYDVSHMIGLPYDWRMSPDKMEKRDGFLTLTRRRIEAAVQSNGNPGIMVAHSMGNSIFRYFLNWLRKELRDEAYNRYIRRAKRRVKAMQAAGMDEMRSSTVSVASSILPGWMSATTGGSVTEDDIFQALKSTGRHEKLWELAQMEGDMKWYDWVETHIWTYVGLSAPLLGAANPLRAVLSGENMGLPMTDPDAREMELTFGSTHTVNMISTKNAFCDQWEIEDSWDEEPSHLNARDHDDSKLACLDDSFHAIETSDEDKPFSKFPALESLLRKRVDWDTTFPMIRVSKAICDRNQKSPCATNSSVDFSPLDLQTGKLFTSFNDIWKEKGSPLRIKYEQLRESFWETDVPNILNQTFERPLIKHVIMAYGVDVPTEAAYEYVKEERSSPSEKDEASMYDSIPTIRTTFWETAGGQIEGERMDGAKPKLTDYFKRKPRRTTLHKGDLPHSGDGSVPYLSLSWAHTWLLHADRAQRQLGNFNGSTNPLNGIEVSHRPEGMMDWIEGVPPNRTVTTTEKKVEESKDTGTAHPHGTRYKPEMVRYHNKGTSRTTGIEYTTTVIEAVAVEHKETTRNYDILAAVFSDVLQYMHDDLDML